MTLRRRTRSSHVFARSVEHLEGRRLLSAGPLGLVADVNATTFSSHPDQHVRLGDVLVFRADDGVHGNEWYATDGTTAGTTLLKDINPGIASSLPLNSFAPTAREMAVVGDTLFFSANDGQAGGTELWKTDGTPAGTVRVKDIIPGPQGSVPQDLVAAGGGLYFSAHHPDTARELWTSDGTEAGTRPVADVIPGTTGSFPVPLGEAGGRLIMAAIGPTGGRELWASDGTAEGTALLKDINSAGGSDPGYYAVQEVIRDVAVVGGEMYFAARDANGREVWKTDGTAAGTVRVTDLPGPAEPRHLLGVGDGVYFVDARPATFTSPNVLYRLDPSLPTGVDRVGEIQWANVRAAHYDAVGGKLFFVGPTQNKVGLFTHDPASPAGTPMTYVKELPLMTGFTAAGLFADVDGVGYFKTRPDDLWRSDGTAAGTYRVREVRPPSGADDTNRAGSWQVVTGPGGAVYTTADDAITGAELYRSDGTVGGTVRVADLNTRTPSGALSGGVALPDGRLLFAGDDGVRGRELWVTDGTADGTRLLKDIIPGLGTGVTPVRYGEAGQTRLGALYGGRVYFAGGSAARQLWASDGTEAGTVMVKEITTGSGKIERLAVGAGRLYIAVHGGAGGSELWSSDGTDAGTSRLAGIIPAYTTTLTAVGDVLYFVADDGTHGRELWKTDGTQVGTMMVEDIGAPSSVPEHLTPHAGKLFFSAVSTATARELWASDGTDAWLVRDVHPGPIDSGPAALTPANFGLFFEASDPFGRDVYVTRGSHDDTVKLRDKGFEIGRGLGKLALLGALDGWAYFFNVYPGEAPETYRVELWKSDGGDFAAQKVADLPITVWPGGQSVALGTADGFLYFRMPGPAGLELWRTDGTAAGTVMVQDLNPGSSGSTPGNLAVAGGRVYFTAYDPAHAYEWRSMLTRPVAASAPRVFYGGAIGNEAASDKAPLRPGGVASFANVTSFARGINGIDLALPGGLPAGLTADDFTFRVGPGGDPAGWAAAPAPASIALLPPAAGDAGLRYRITWANGAVRNGWLEVTVKDNGRTGLARPDVFYFGNLVGETGGDAATPAVTMADVQAVRRAMGSRSVASGRYDFDRNGRVDARDMAVVRRAVGRTLAPVTLPPPASLVQSAAELLSGRTKRERRGVYELPR